MGEVIFEYENGNRPKERPAYRNVSRKEYYKGEYQIVPSDQASVVIEKGLDSSFSIIKLRSSSPLKFKRNWLHIRHDNVDVSVLWFVQKGSIVFTHGGRTDVVGSGQCALTRTLQPFRMECLTDAASHHEVLHVVVPTHLVLDHIPDHVRPGTSFSSRTGDCRLALRTFELLYEEGTGVSQRAANGLAREAFAAVGSLVTSEHQVRPRSIADKRFDEILEFIDEHLSSPGLSLENAARGVGISPSYLMHILKVRGQTFSDILWQSRIDRAKKMLLADSMSGFSVKQIAYRTGFKSAAHFSRAFKSATEHTPGEFRRSP